MNLAWYRGRQNVVLAFYPGDWTPVCAQQIPGFQQVIHRFAESNCKLLAISVDSVPCHAAWARSMGGLSFPLMSDYYPHGTTAARYGVLADRGYAERAVFLIDLQGIIRYIERVPLVSIPDNDRLFEVLAKLPVRLTD